MFQQLNEILLSYPSVDYEYKVEWQMHLYRIGGKIFAEIGNDKSGLSILTVKLEPAMSELLRQQYPGRIVPGYYCNKTHWSSAAMDGSVPMEILRMMMDSAYHLVRTSLSQKLQASLG